MMKVVSAFASVVVISIIVIISDIIGVSAASSRQLISLYIFIITTSSSSSINAAAWSGTVPHELLHFTSTILKPDLHLHNVRHSIRHHLLIT